MKKLASLRIDVSKINKEKLYHGKKGVYYDMTVLIDDVPNKVGNHLEAWEKQSEEDREQKAERKFLGGGKIFWEQKPEAYNPDTLPYNPKDVEGPKLPWE